jgi:hypothetical protein
MLLFISRDFIASNQCWEKEVEIAMSRHHSGEATVIRIMLRESDWTNAPFANLQGLPQEMKAVTAQSDRDAAWTGVAEGIRSIAEGL